MIEDRFIIERALIVYREFLSDSLDMAEMCAWTDQWIVSDRIDRLEVARINAELNRRRNPIAHAGADHGHSPIALLGGRA